MQKYKLTLLASSILITLGYIPSAYTEEQETTTDVATSDTLETIVVSDTSFSQQIGTQKITEEQIKRRPTTNGNITELLKSNPNVSFSNLAETSMNAGEIRPEEVSFHGEKYYNNNFTIDGISNNDNVNPATYSAGRSGKNPTGYEAYDLPSAGSQSFWLDTSLLKSVEAFDSNVSAKYGNFTGGVVNAEIKDPLFDKQHGHISYRTTRGSWAKFHVQDSDVDDFYAAKRMDFQPEFTKNQYSVSVSQPLSDSTSLLFSYNRSESKIKYLHPYLYYTSNPLGLVTENQRRRNETYLLKGVHIAENGDLWKATFMYSPHSEKYYKANVVDSGYSNTGGGYSFNLNWDKDLGDIKMNTVFSYKHTGNKISHDADVYRRYVSTGATGGEIDWRSNATGYALYGGYGSYETEKDTFTLKQDYSAKEFDWGETAHKLKFGWIAELAQAKYKRNNEAWQYYYDSANISCSGMNECIDGEQYATSAQAYPKKKVKVNDTSYAIYLEDNIKWKRLDVNLGARVDYNQYLKNINLAPRISLNYDVLGNGDTNLFAGYNRYYANSMLAYKLRQGIGNRDKWERNASTNYQWVYKSSGSTTVKQATSDLETPYSDEYVLGIGQKFLGIETVLKWVHRNGRDQFTRKTINGYYTLTNDGWSKNDSVTLTFDKIGEYKFKYANLDWGLSFRYNKNKTNNSNYEASSEYLDYDYAVYNGQLIQAEDLPNNDFNSKWSASLNVNTEFPAIGLTWDQRFSYVGGYNYIAATTSSINCQYSANKSICGSLYGQDIDATKYEDASIGSQFLVDWRFAYKYPFAKDNYAEITLDINNVFNSSAKAQSSGSTTYYKMGRNFWLGASYHW